MSNKTKVGFALLFAGVLLAAGDYVVTHASTPPGSFGTAIVNIDDLNGTLSGVAPAVGVGSLLALAGIASLVIL